MPDPVTVDALVKVAEVTAVGVATKDVIKAVLVPPAEEVGEVLRLTVRRVLSGVRRFLMSPDEIEAWATTEISKRLVGVPSERIQEPAPHVFVPALSAVAYTTAEELRDAFANLLAKAMDSATAEDVHPSFVEVLKQLTPGEARILAVLEGDEEVPLFRFDPVIEGPGVEGFSVFPGVRHFSDLPTRAHSSPSLSRFSLAISSLRRNNLAELNRTKPFQLVAELNSPAFSRLLATDSLLRAEVESRLAVQLPLRVDTIDLLLTPFGRSFCATCIRQASRR